MVEVHGAHNVAQRARWFGQRGGEAKPAVINGSAGWVGLRNGEIFSASEFTVRDGRIATMNFISDPERIKQLDITILDW